jgi:hypothetical protein
LLLFSRGFYNFEFSMDLPRRFRIVGIAILAVGLLAAGTVFLTQSPDDDIEILGVDIPTKRDILQMERMGGTANVIAGEITTWFVGLWHGRKLVYTLGFLSIGGFLICFSMADFVANSPTLDDQKQDDVA